MDYSKYEKKARNKINQYGGNCTIIRNGDEVYNEETNEYESTKVEITGKAICSAYDEKYINGSSIMAGDVNLMAVFEKEPAIGDVIKFGDKNYNVVNCQSVNPDGKCVIYYNIQAR